MATKTPRVFTVGDEDHHDFTPDEIELLTFRVRDWFISDECDRSYSDPYAEAKAQVEQCLLAQTKAGKIWHKAYDSFASRLKSKTLYDMEEGNHIAQDRAKSTEAKRNKRHADNVTGALPVTSTLSVQHLQQYQKRMESDILSAYPELDTAVHRPNITRLAMLYSEQERIRIEMPGSKAGARKQAIDTLSVLQKTISDTMKSLDIYPDQIRKRMDKQRQGSVGDLVAAIDEDVDFKEREKRWTQTLALQLWWMTKHPNGKNTGPNIHDFEMWHLTRTRPIRYTCKCGHEAVIVEGFTPEELRDYLVQSGVLVEKPVLPQITTEEDLHGLAAYGSTDATPDAPEDLELVDEAGDESTESV